MIQVLFTQHVMPSILRIRIIEKWTFINTVSRARVQPRIFSSPAIRFEVEAMASWWRLWPFQSKDKENVPIQPYSRMSSEFSINLFVNKLESNNKKKEHDAHILLALSDVTIFVWMAFAKIFRCNKQTVDYYHETKTGDRWRLRGS